MSDVNENLEKISQMFKAESFEPFIKFIEFSSFKNFNEKSRITFTYPITALVGGNGTNKSSVLKALESCCPDKIISNRWFSTDVDAISHDPVPQFWYAYDLQENKNKHEAQVLIAKHKRDEDPDYWEAAKPKTSIGMKSKPTTLSSKKEWGSKTRWNKINKEGIYLTFRETISAFDKFFYYGDTIEKYYDVKSRKDHIRRYSKHLNKVINNNLSSFTFRRKPKVSANYILDSNALKYISDILELPYSSIQIIEHTFFNCSGITCKIEKNDINYSEAFAGSGEFAVIKIVHEILKAKDKSLILLDEPEVSLHPGAQERLMNFVVEQTKNKKLQIVIATHSPILINHLPSEAIKTLSLNKSTQKIEINDNGCNAAEAFYHLGHITNNKIRFIVEDKLAEQLVKYASKDLTNAQKSLFEIKYYKGGAFDILNNFAVVYALSENFKVFIYLDGDQKRDPLPNAEDLTDSEILKLNETFKSFCGGDLQLPQNSNMSKDEKKKLFITILNWLKKQVIFLPTAGNPESIIWDKLDSEYKNEINDISSDYKVRFKLLTEKMYPPDTNIDGNFIHNTQLLKLAQINVSDPDLIEIKKTILEKITA